MAYQAEKPNGGIFYGSDYFPLCFEYAVKLIKEGKAYVCDLSKEDVIEYKGTDRPRPAESLPTETEAWKKIWTCSTG